MFAVIDNQANAVVYLLDDEPSITDGGMVSPRALDVRPGTHSVLEVGPPPVAFWPGQLRVVGGVWSVIDQSAYDAATAPPPQPVPEEISDRQFFEALAMVGLITESEALAAVSNGTLPASFEAFIASLPAGERFPAKMALKGATVFKRSHPLTNAFGAMSGMSSADVDGLWRMAAAIE